MLKLIYTETSLHLELPNEKLASWIERRQAFAASVGEDLVVSQSTATFLLPESICEFAKLDAYIQHERVTALTVTRCDLDRVEIGLRGYWLSTEIDSVEGTFVAQLSVAAEAELYRLWHHANSRSIVNDNVLG